MKKTKLILIALIWGYIGNLSAQNREEKIFKRALSFLVKHELKEPVSVADSVIFLEYSPFFDQVASKADRSSKVLDSLDRVDSQRSFPPYFKKGSHISASKSIVFFSKPYKKTLLMEVFTQNKPISSRNYIDLTRSGESTLYLLHFNCLHQIKKYYKATLNYN